ncbi:MAG: hypothetical protein ACSHYF_00695 [Verrucomicrobiaceae bacterium]
MRKSLLFAIFSLSASAEGLLDHFPTLLTIAGKGDLENGNVADPNFWIPTYEGASPLSVELSNPHDAGTDFWGNVYIVDKESHSILRVDPDGAAIHTVAGTHTEGNGTDSPANPLTVALNNPNGLHVLAHGTVYILDTGNQKIRKVDQSGICATVIHYPAGFGAGRGLWVSEDEKTIYFCGEYIGGGLQKVMRYTSQDGLVEFTRLPAGQNGLGNLDVAPDRSVGITSAGDNRVYRVRNPGATPTVIAGTGFTGDGPGVDGTAALDAHLDRVRGIAFLPDGSYFLATQKGGDIWWVDLSGNIHRLLSGSGSGNIRNPAPIPRNPSIDQISEPRSIHLASNGDLIITCNDEGIIRSIKTSKNPLAPALSLARDSSGFLQLAFKGGYQGQFLLQGSDDLRAQSWEDLTVLTTEAPTTQRLLVPDNQDRRFWRLLAPRAGGYP